MKVYVDELPKKCEDCVFSETGFVWDSEVRFCKLKPKCMNWIALYDDKRDDCTLCSLADYTKQVRKEVCEEIRTFAYDTFKEFGCFDEVDLEHILEKMQELEQEKL